MSPLEYWIVDAFTATPFKGNSAAVVFLHPNSPLPDPTLQLIASEFNLSETAFVIPVDASKGRFGLRWFTPTMEFPLCGHATLASAAVLFFHCCGGILPEGVKVIEFATLSSILRAQALSDGRIELEFPAGETTTIPDSLADKVTQAIQQSLNISGASKICAMGVGKGISFGKYILIEVDGINLEEATIDSNPLKSLPPNFEVIILTQQGRDARETFASRVFCPTEDIPEDPVTGSAHCMLGPYWAKKLQIPGSVEMIGKQVSKRSGVVGMIWNREEGTCMPRGNTILVAKGGIHIPN